MGVEQRAGPGTNPRIPRVVSKSDSGHGTATTATEPLDERPRVLFAIVTSPSITILYIYNRMLLAERIFRGGVYHLPLTVFEV